MKSSPNVRKGALRFWGVQVAVLLAVLAVLAWFGATAWSRMQAQGIAQGFGILFQSTGWPISSPFLDQSPSDPYWWTLVVAIVNTLVVSAVGIVLATLCGLVVGLALTIGSRPLRALGMVYVEMFRNVPLVLQAVFWYVVLTSLPGPRANPPAVADAVFVSNQGLAMPAATLAPDAGSWLWICGAAAVALALVALRYLRTRRAWSRGPAALVAMAVGAGLAFVLALATPALQVSLPVLKGFSYRGGIMIPVEFVALVFATVIFGAAYVAEIFRGGLNSVPAGQTEAAQALGLRPQTVFVKVQLPIALRSMVPPLANIYLFIVKATAIGSAVGYAELFSASVVSISQTGQAVEFLVTMMVAYFIINYSITTLMNGFNRAIAFKGGRS